MQQLAQNEELDAALVEAIEGLTDDDAEPFDTLMLEGLRQRMGLVDELPRLQRFELHEQLGSGGMGVVYAAYDPRTDRRVAIKLLRLGGPSGIEHLMHEARALAQLSHPNVVTVYEVGLLEGQPFVVMELVEGQTLRHWLQQPRSWRSICRAMVAAGRGLVAAHAAGIVHRDFKPDNVLMGERVRVADFGLALSTWPVTHSFDEDDEVPDDAGVQSVAGGRPGTLAYMAPEQLRGDPVDARTDQFALCLVLYEALAGQRPFRAQTPLRRLEAIDAGPVPGGLDGVPKWLRALVLRGLHPDPAKRHPDLGGLLDAIEQHLRPRSRWVVGLGGGVVLAAVLGLGVSSYELAPCRDAQAGLDGVWDDERRAAVESALLGTGASYAPDTWARVHQGLDDYASAWVAAHTDACEATSVRAEQPARIMDLRMGCLQRRRAELQQVVEVLGEANEARARRAVELVSGLVAPSRCDEEALDAEQPLPEDAELAERVGALRERLVRARTLGKATEVERALVEVDAVMEQTLTLGFPPLVTEARFHRGSLRTRAGQAAQAREDLEQAYLEAVAQGNDRLAARAAIELVHVLGYMQAEHERALWWGETGLARSRRRGIDPALETTLLSYMGTVLTDQGEPERALEYHQRAYAMQQDADAPAVEVAHTLIDLGNAYLDQGELEEALDCFQQALAAQEAALGTSHPLYASSLNNIGLVLLEQGKLDEALDHHHRAREIFEAALGEAHPHVGSAWANIGNVQQAQGRYDQARQSFERALANWEQSVGPEHPQVGQLLNNLGTLLGTMGRLEESLALVQRSLVIMEQALGSEHPFIAQSLANLGVTQWRLGRLDEASASLERARALYERTRGPWHPGVAHALVGLAEIELARGEPADARPAAERAVEVLESGDLAPAELAYARFLLARALWGDPTQHAEAQRLAEQARASYVAIGEAGVDEAARIEAWLEQPSASAEAGEPWFSAP